MNQHINQMDLHTHTTASGHAYSSLTEMAKAASEIPGLKLLGITDHAPGIPGAPQPIYFANLSVVPHEMFGIRLLFGSEINITDYNGALSLPERYIQMLDFCIAGIHKHCYTPGTIEQNTAAVIGAISHPHIHLISHPDDGSVPLDYKAVVLAAKEHHTLLEVNNNSIRSDGPSRPDVKQNVLTMLSLCKQYEVPVVMSSDAHFHTDIANFDHCLPLLQQAAFPDELIINYNMEKMLKYIGIDGIFKS